MLVLMLVINWLLSSALLGPPASTTVSYTFFRQQLLAGNVKEITSTGDTIDGEFRSAVQLPRESSNETVTRFDTHRPAFANDNLFELLQGKDVEINAQPETGPPLWERLLIGLLPALLLVGLFVLLGHRAGGLGGFGGLGRSRARRYDPTTAPRVIFDDVAGIDEVRDEVVDFLQHPDKYRRVGARMPKGVLLSGAPGTGKTLLARAVAGEAGVPFYSVSASEFIEMIVGVGASRVRDLFTQAKATAPSIIFIDELDAVGRARGDAIAMGGHDEREQTLNQILTEMDGFTGTEGVVVMAATNRPEILDPALLRPGRFDRRLVINAAGRRQILDVHVRGVALTPDVDLDAVAATTPGMVGADLRNLVNEAALETVRRGGDRIRTNDFANALEGIMLGAARRIVLTEDERRRTAYHESGHALLGMLTEGADPVRKISIIPRTHALGVTVQSPETDRYTYDSRYLHGRIAGMLAGRAAERVVFGDTSTGAENDLQQATQLARQMVGRWGMSPKVGAVSVLPDPRTEQWGGLDGHGPAPATRELLDAEVHRIIDACHETAIDTLTRNRQRLDTLATTLLRQETLDSADAYAAAGLPPHTPAPLASPLKGPSIAD
jgi:cell division protease FtsH